MAELGLQPGETLGNLSGVGGNAAAVSVNTSIRLQKEDGILVGFHGGFTAFTDQDSLDMSILGRNILDGFAVIVVRPRDAVCLLGQNHHYVIKTV